ncbi:MAG: enoyl-CoA hydratase-related protein [Gammaproteobacteria bacterium]|nr:enoyl-CoA hydratase-related protein [Gammaproteobacteria bacterium]MDE0366619.1 enoyl-CoA hydratase-related protein [Gammaproteobacteria bacterium]
MEFNDYQRMRLTRRGRVLTITLDNGKVNAVDGRMHKELARVFLDAQDDDGSDLVVLTGAGRAFCAGGDMDWFLLTIEDPREFRAIAPEAKRIVTSLLDLEKPLICRLNGAAAGLGATIALLCDIIVAADTAAIGDPHVKAGLVAGDGGAIIWPQLIGFARAKELLMTGDMLPAGEAARHGLINHVVPADELDAKVDEIAGKILANPRWAVRWTKTATNITLRELAVKLLDPAIAYEIVTNMTDDRREAVAAFIERRKPEFTGE